MILAHDEDASKGIKQPDISPKDNSQSSSPGPKLLTICCASDPDAETTSREAVYAAARRYVEAGLSIIPIAADGTKQPYWQLLPKALNLETGERKFSWKIFQVRRPTPDELRRWYETGEEYGLAVLGGIVSGGLEIIDFDTIQLARPWIEWVGKKSPGLIERLVRIQSPRPGMHFYYRCPQCGSSQKLACAPMLGDEGKLKKKTLIEVKGEGGYCLAPSSPGRCHSTGKLYRVIEESVDFTQIPTITAEERTLLLTGARMFDIWEEPERERQERVSIRPINLDLPGDDFNQRGDWRDVLCPAGWTQVSCYGEEERWCRPGKEGGVSATVNYEGNGLLHVFSSNADPLEDGHSYSKFAAFANLYYDGDFHMAAEALREKGFGKQTLGYGQRKPLSVQAKER